MGSRMQTGTWAAAGILEHTSGHLVDPKSSKFLSQKVLTTATFRIGFYCLEKKFSRIFLISRIYTTYHDQGSPNAADLNRITICLIIFFVSVSKFEVYHQVTRLHLPNSIQVHLDLLRLIHHVPIPSISSQPHGSRPQRILCHFRYYFLFFRLGQSL